MVAERRSFRDHLQKQHPESVHTTTFLLTNLWRGGGGGIVEDLCKAQCLNSNQILELFFFFYKKKSPC